MKQIISLSIIFFLITVIINLIFSIETLWSKKDVLTHAQLQLVEEQQEHIRLEKQWQQVQNPSFIEEQARDKLFLSKPGETLVLIPTASPSAAPIREQAGKTVWQQWLNLFF